MAGTRSYSRYLILHVILFFLITVAVEVNASTAVETTWYDATSVEYTGSATAQTVTTTTTAATTTTNTATTTANTATQTESKILSQTIAANSGNPALKSITLSRSFGIKAGGTKVNVTVEFYGNVVTTNFTKCIYFGQNLLYASEPTEILPTTLVHDIRSPPSDNVGNVTVILQDVTGRNWTVSNFTYRDNPSINGVHPTQHLTSGGTRLTVEGQNLDAAESSVIQLMVTVYRGGQISEIRDPTNSDCFSVNVTSQSLVCRMPVLNLPADFLKKLENDFKAKSGNSISNARKRRATENSLEVARFTNDKNDLAIARMQILNDGYASLYNASSNLNFNPRFIEVFPAKDVIQVKTGNPEALRIQGNNFGIIAADNYVISLGADNCTVTTVTDNLIVCLPPDKLPKDSTLFPGILSCAADNRIIVVSLNLNTDELWRYGCAGYHDGLPVLIIAFASVAGFLVLVVLVLLGLLIARTIIRKTRRPAKKGLEPKRLPRAHITSSVVNSLRAPSLNRSFSKLTPKRKDFSELFSQNMDDLNYDTKIQNMDL